MLFGAQKKEKKEEEKNEVNLFWALQVDREWRHGLKTCIIITLPNIPTTCSNYSNYKTETTWATAGKTRESIPHPGRPLQYPPNIFCIFTVRCCRSGPTFHFDSDSDPDPYCFKHCTELFFLYESYFHFPCHCLPGANQQLHICYCLL
jgi:hypothetical protein